MEGFHSIRNGEEILVVVNDVIVDDVKAITKDLNTNTRWSWLLLVMRVFLILFLIFSFFLTHAFIVGWTVLYNVCS